MLAKLGDARITAARIAAAVADGDADLADGAVRAARQLVRTTPAAADPCWPRWRHWRAMMAGRRAWQAPTWRTRLAAVRVLAALGPAGRDARPRGGGQPIAMPSCAPQRARRSGRARDQAS